MRRLVQFLARLYPLSWRSRYEAEFQALLDDINPTWRTALNIVTGAVAMQLRTLNLRLLAVSAVLGILAGLGIWIVMPNQYRSTAIIRIQTRDRLATSRTISSTIKAVLTRHSLGEIVQKYELYPAKQAKLPLKEVIADMERSIEFRVNERGLLMVQFDYPDPVIAKSVADELVERFMSQELELRADSATFMVLDAPNIPINPVSPNPLPLAVVGLLGGMLMGSSITLLLRWRGLKRQVPRVGV
jgi:capsular polysaccharide biosynthesis protein